MAKFRAKPIEVEAIQFTGSNFYACAHFLGYGDLTDNDVLHPTDRPAFLTAEGPVSVPVGWWIVRHPGPAFERFTPDQFVATFEPVPEDTIAGAGP